MFETASSHEARPVRLLARYSLRGAPRLPPGVTGVFRANYLAIISIKTIFMARQFQLLVFDWDGTVADSAALIVDSIRSACDDLHLPVPSEQDCRYVIGLGLHDSMRRLLPALAEQEYPPFLDQFRHYFLQRDHETPLFHGIGDLLGELEKSGHWLAVATGKSRVGLQRSFEQTGIEKRFHATRCADESHPKPNPAMLFDVMNALGIDKESTLMIGDTSHDLLMAQNAGVAAVAVSYGAHDVDALRALNPLACVDSVAELRAWLIQNA
jgi:phosphoglycolate phosphatase